MDEVLTSKERRGFKMKYLSRKFLLVVGYATLIIVNKTVPLNLTDAELWKLAGLIVGYLAAEGTNDLIRNGYGRRQQK